MNEQVLVIDDEPQSVESIVDLLTDVEEISCRGETDPEKAIASFRENPTDVVIVDYLLSTLDGLTGLDVIARLRDIKPFTRFVLISGYVPFEADDSKISDQLINQIKVDRYVRKPISGDELVTVVHELLANIETVSDDWQAISAEYVSKGKITAEDVRSLNEEFKNAILKAFPEKDDE
jgi:two-component system, response regulator YesN